MGRDDKRKKMSGAEEISAAKLLPRLERLARLLRMEGHAEGLNPAQWEALRYLARCNRFSNSPLALSTYLDTTKGTVSQTIMALERKGLISKQPRPGQYRSLVLSLTDQGRAYLERDPLLGIIPTLEEIGAKARRRMGRVVAEVLVHETRRRGLSSFGTCQACRFFREAPQEGIGEPFYCQHFEQALAPRELQQMCVAQVTSTGAITRD